MKKTGTCGSGTMRREYDFSKGVRGKHYLKYREGHTVRVRKKDSTVFVQYFTQEEGAVMLDPDVRAQFPDSESVNRALRTLIREPNSKMPRNQARHLIMHIQSGSAVVVGGRFHAAELLDFG